jgi:uncharacterized damage-inducible protein DinB
MNKSNETTEVLLHLVAQSYNRHAWHGPNLRWSLRGLTAEEAAWTPGPGRHSIWELTLHCAYWKYVVIRKLEGRGRGTFARSPSNFPHLPEPADTTAWKADVAFLDQTHRELLESVRKALARPAKEASARAKIHHLIEGVASHDVYHAGQIRLLIRLRAASLGVEHSARSRRRPCQLTVAEER